MQKQDWEIRIRIVEQEGGMGSINPWYTARDVSALINLALVRNGPIRDLKIENVTAHEVGSVYMDSEKAGRQ